MYHPTKTKDSLKLEDIKNFVQETDCIKYPIVLKIGEKEYITECVSYKDKKWLFFAGEELKNNE